MAENLEKPNNNQHLLSQNRNEYPVKATETESKTITNIYYDCLERILEFLDLESLLNLAGTCKRRQIAATVKFGEDFGKKETILRLCGRS